MEQITPTGDKWEDEPKPDWYPLPVAESYYPTRLEYFAGKALQGLVIGRAPKDLLTVVKRAIDLAVELESAIDSEKD